MTSTTDSRVQVRPGGLGTTALMVVSWLGAAIFVAGIIAIVRVGSGVGVSLAVLAPSAIVLGWAVYAAHRVAAGFVIERAGIRRAAQSLPLMSWPNVAGLRWARTPRWGRRNHQLVADRRNGRTVIVWGVRNPTQHDRIVAGLRRAEDAGLIPPDVLRSPDLYAPWDAVTAHLG